MKQKNIIAVTLLGLVFLAGPVVLVWQVPSEALLPAVEEHRILGAVLLATLMFASTVIAPMTTLPLVPVVAPFLGPFTTAVASITGWTLGAIVAFLIARYGGRPLMAHFVDIDALGRYESQIPKNAHFLLLVMLRMAIPVDALSYALGLFSMVPFREYVLTTFIGVIWFSFAFSYLGSTLDSGDYVLFGGIGVASAIVFLTAFSYVRKVAREDRGKD